MKKKLFLKVSCSLLLSVFLTSFSAKAQGYEISVKINGISQKEVILGHHFNSNLIPDDTIVLDKSGAGKFKGKEPLQGGLYFIFLPNHNFFDLLIGKNQKFTITNDTTDFIQNARFTGSEENNLFYEYQLFLENLRKQASALQEKIKSASTDSEKSSAEKELNALSEKVSQHQSGMIKNHQGTFFATFLTAMKEPDVPDAPRDSNGKITDSTFQYRYYKKHYFDNFNLSDSRLLYTPFYENKLKSYIEKVIPQIPDSIIPETDYLIESSRGTPETFRFVLGTLYNLFGASQIVGMDAVFVHIADKYYIPEATWSDSVFIAKLKEDVRKKKPLLLGKVAPDVQLVHVDTEHFKAAATDSALAANPYVGDFFNLHSIQAKYLIILFWEADCGHCKKSLPILHKAYEDLKSKGVEVLAIHMLGGSEGKEKWIQYVNDHNYYDWINAWNPYDYTYKEKYSVVSSPTIFILDKDKKILVKGIGAEQVEKIIDLYEEEQNRK